MWSCLLTKPDVNVVSELNPMPTEEICHHFNELRSDLVLLYELKSALSTCEFELQTLRHRFEAFNPGKVCEMMKT